MLKIRKHQKSELCLKVPSFLDFPPCGAGFFFPTFCTCQGGGGVGWGRTLSQHPEGGGPGPHLHHLNFPEGRTPPQHPMIPATNETPLEMAAAPRGTGHTQHGGLEPGGVQGHGGGQAGDGAEARRLQPPPAEAEEEQPPPRVEGRPHRCAEGRGCPDGACHWPARNHRNPQKGSKDCCINNMQNNKRYYKIIE